MLGLNVRLSRGDTLVEVMFATAVFSLVAVSSTTIMNQGIVTAERSLELSLVRSEIDAQAATLRFLNASYVAAFRNSSSPTAFSLGLPERRWATMLSDIKAVNLSNVSNFGTTCPTSASGLPAGSFILNTRTAEYVSPSTLSGVWQKPQTFSQISYTATSNVSQVYGIWIEAVRKHTTLNTDPQRYNEYIDFHIRACWEDPGKSAPMTLGTIVRLYEPTD